MCVCVCVCVCVCELLSHVRLFVTPCKHTRLLCQWDFLGRVGCHFPLQGIFPTWGSKLGLLHWQVDSLSPASPGKPNLCRLVVNLLCGCISVLVWGL